MPTAYRPQPRAAKRATGGGAVHAVGLGLEGVPGVEALERYVQVLQRRGDEEQARGQRHVQGLRHVEAPLGDLVAALDQVRCRAQRECQQRRPGEHLIPQHAGEQQLAAAGGDTDAGSGRGRRCAATHR